ncbi:MAG: OmpA family protein [Bacteroidia bacterium]
MNSKLPIKKTITLFYFLAIAQICSAQNIIGLWKTPQATASIQYQFFAEGKMTYNFYGDLSSFNRKGNYHVANDSIFIQYDSLTKEEMEVYRIKGKLNEFDTLYIVNTHTIKIAPSFYIHNIAIPKTFDVTDTSFFKGQILRSYQIRFDIAKSTLRPESCISLDSMATFLKQHPQLKIEISVHSDTRASKSYSTCLTCNRAQAIYTYLVSKGVNANQLVYKGYEGRNPIISDEAIKKMQKKELQEEAHQKNRRVEYKILEIESV